MVNYRKTISWSLMVVVLVQILTGYGITRYRLIEKITFGILTKPMAFQLHSILMLPLAILIILHVYPSVKDLFNRN